MPAARRATPQSRLLLLAVLLAAAGSGALVSTAILPRLPLLGCTVPMPRSRAQCAEGVVKAASAFDDSFELVRVEPDQVAASTSEIQDEVDSPNDKEQTGDAEAIDAATSFEGLGVTVPVVIENLKAASITTPNSLQLAAFEPIASGRDVLMHAHTGSGKTLAFLLPLIEQLDPSSKEPQALVLSPSRELAYQTYRVAEMLLKDSPLRVVSLAGGANPSRQVERVRKERPQLLIGTAGRVCELNFEAKKLKLQRVRHLVLDEVDEALRTPHLEPTTRLIELMQDRRRLQLIFASATADTPMVQRSALQLMESPLLLQLQLDGATSGGVGLPPHLVHALCAVPAPKQIETLGRFARISPAPKALVFVNSPHRAQLVAQMLVDQYGVRAASLHGKQEREERVAVMRAFHSGKLPLIISTEMGARGLDIPGLTHVLNLELPTDERHYVHRAGRCGRAGVAGTVLSLVPHKAAPVLAKLASRLGVELAEMQVRAGQLEEAEASPPRGPRAKAAGGQGSKAAAARRQGGDGAKRGARGGAAGAGSGRGRAGGRGKSSRGSDRMERIGSRESGSTNRQARP